MARARRPATRGAVVTLAVLALAAGACGSDDGGSPPTRGGPSRSADDGGPPELDAPDRWDRALAPGSTIVVHRNVQVVGPGGSPPNDDEVTHLESMSDLAVDHDGSVLVVDHQAGRVLRASPSGALEVVAGPGRSSTGANDPPGGDLEPRQVAVGPDGSRWVIGATGLHRLDASGTLETVLPFPGRQHPTIDQLAGSPLATTLELPPALQLAIDRQGRPLLAWGRIVARLEADGTLVHIAGNGGSEPGEGGPATAAAFVDVDDLQVRPDGTIVVLDGGAGLVRAISPSGTVTTWGGVVPRTIERDVGPFDGRARGMALDHRGVAWVIIPEVSGLLRVTEDDITEVEARMPMADEITSLPDGSLVLGSGLGTLTRVGT